MPPKSSDKSKRSSNPKGSNNPKHSEKSRDPKKSKDSEEPEDSNKRRKTLPQSSNPRHGPGPRTSTHGGQAADQRTSHQGGAPFGASASSRSAYDVGAVTTDFAALNVAAAVQPQGGPSLGYYGYGPLAGPFPGQYPPYPSNQPEQSGTNPSAEYDEYGRIAGPTPGTWSDDPYGLHNAPQSEQARLTQYRANAPSQYSNNPPATGMGTARAALIDYQPETRGSTTSLLKKKDPDWSDKEDKELLYLKEQYYGYGNAKTLIGQGMHRAGFTNRTEDACHSRWERKLKARNPNLKPKAWSAEEDKRLIQLVTNFPWWNTHNGWLEVSEHMSPRRAPEPCRDRWHKPLREPANSGELTDEEKKLLVDLDSRNYGIFEMVDLLSVIFALSAILSMLNRLFSG